MWSDIFVPFVNFMQSTGLTFNGIFVSFWDIQVGIILLAFIGLIFFKIVDGFTE